MLHSLHAHCTTISLTHLGIPFLGGAWVFACIYTHATRYNCVDLLGCPPTVSTCRASHITSPFIHYTLFYYILYILTHYHLHSTLPFWITACHLHSAIPPTLPLHTTHTCIHCCLHCPILVPIYSAFLDGFYLFSSAFWLPSLPRLSLGRDARASALLARNTAQPVPGVCSPTNDAWQPRRVACHARTELRAGW